MTEGSLLAVGVSHRTAPVGLLERLALDSDRAMDVMRRVGSVEAVHGAVVLSTCNRTEIYMAASDSTRAEGAAKEALGLTRPLHSYFGAEAVDHLFRVTAGLDSVAVGETEIQGQVKRAFELAVARGQTGPVINRLFRSALEAGKRARSQNRRPPPSVASLAVVLAVRRLEAGQQPAAVVLGAGENASAVGRALARRRVRTVFVATRRHGRAVELARRFGGRAADSCDLWAELVAADVAFTCTSSRHPIVSVQDLARVVERRRGRPLLLLDTAVPRDVEPTARGLTGVELYDIDDIKAQASADTAPPGHMSAVIEHEVRRFQTWLASLDVVPAISALRAHGAAAARETLAEAASQWESLSTRDRERVEMVARAVVSRMLHQPTMALRAAAGTDAAAGYAQAIQDLLGAQSPNGSLADAVHAHEAAQ